MDFIIGLLWIGLWIGIALFVVQIVFTVGMMIIGLVFTGIGILWEKLTDKENK